MKGWVLLLIIIPGLSGFSQAKPDTAIRGVKVSFAYSPGIFPGFWKEAPIHASAEQIPGNEISRSIVVLINALDKYPSLILERELKAVYFLKTMKFYDVGYGGTNSDDALYLTNNGTASGYTDLYLEQTFHHEFSSILYRNHPSYFRENVWYRNNPLGFIYTDPENGVGAIRNNQSSQDLDTNLCKKGFLTEYATSGMENDLNTYAQNLFSPSPGFWEIVEQYPRIKKKVKLVVSFYNKVNPLFTMNYFKKLDK
jgi:hypothetical protein